MAFVMELIPQEEINSEFFRTLRKPSGAPFEFERPNPGWIIDRDRNAFMIYLASGGREPVCEYFCMCWKGQKIQFFGELDYRRVGGSNVVAWRNVKITIPAGLLGERKEITDAFKDALDLYGHYGNREYVGRVTFDFLQEEREQSWWSSVWHSKS